jgi:DNA primase
MLSLGGVYEPNKDPAKRKLPVALKNMLGSHPEVTSIALHLDNDHAGKAASWAIEGLLKDKYNVAYESPPYGKDYNDYLRNLLS